VQVISDLRKAAVMLTCLPGEAAAQLLEKLDPMQVKIVSEEIGRIGKIDGAQQSEILDEFANAISGPQGVASDRLQALQNIRRQIGAVPFKFLHNVDSQSLISLLIDEQSQTIALVACHLPSAQAALIIAGLSGDQQLAVIRRLATIQDINPEIIQDVERGLIASVMNQQMAEVGGINHLAEILCFMPREVAHGLQLRLAQEDSRLADELSRLLSSEDAHETKPMSRPLTELRTSTPARAA
jgi:flagellar motor switch protein FliG